MGAKKSKQKVVTLTFTRQEVDEMQEAFNLFDMDKNGAISLKELDGILKKLGQPMPQSDLIRIMAEVDLDSDGVIDFGEFLIMMKRLASLKDREAEIREMFEVFDIRKKGRFTAEDLRAVMNNIGEEATDEDITEMMQEADVDKDGVVTFSEFRSLCDRLELV